MFSTNTTTRDLFSQQVMEFLENKIETAMPAVVTDVSKLTTHQQVSLKVTVHRVFEDGNALTGADLIDVPVMFPAGGGGSITFPVKVGDIMLVLFSKRCIDEWKNGDGSAVTPRLVRHFNKSDGIAIPGLGTVLNNSAPDPDNVVLKYAGSDVTLFSNGNVRASAAQDLNAIAGGNIQLNAVGNINITAGGTITMQASEVHINE